MTTFLWILVAGIGMSLLALVGALALFIPTDVLKRLLLPLVAFAAGSLIGGAFFHMIPAALTHDGVALQVCGGIVLGFVAFFALEQFLHWHHCHRAEADCRTPVTYLILFGDALHNFVGGVAVAGTFLIDVRLGIAAWIAAAAHEVPQELGDFAVLVHGGWSRARALTFNFASALTFLVGGVVTYAASASVDVTFIVPFAAGNFIYIAASDLVPEVNKHRSPAQNVIHFVAFVAGLALLFAIRWGAGP
ncbi:MAG: ZIP family metal transporter [Gemmatimonadales bacterium]|jgi:zinc and cadmium transporter